MAGEAALMNALKKRAAESITTGGPKPAGKATKQFRDIPNVAAPPDITNDAKATFIEKMKNSAKVATQQEFENPADVVHTSKMIDQNVATPTQSELQDIRGVPDEEFQQVQERTSRNKSPKPQNVTRDEISQYHNKKADEWEREADPFGDSPYPTTNNPYELLMDEDILDMRRAPPNEPAPELEKDPRRVEQKNRLRDVLELRSLVRSGKMAASPQEKQLVEKLYQQEKQTHSDLLRELLEEGLR